MSLDEILQSLPDFRKKKKNFHKKAGESFMDYIRRFLRNELVILINFKNFQIVVTVFVFS